MLVKKVLINPFWAFLWLWLIVFLLFQLQASGRLAPMPEAFRLHVFFVAFSAFLGFGIGFWGMSVVKYRVKSVYWARNRLRRIVTGLFGILCVVFPFTVVISGGIPILYYLTGSGGPPYTQFGIPSLQGFFNSVLLFVGSLTFWSIISGSSSRLDRFVFFASLSVPVISVHRQSMMSLLIQCITIYIAVKIWRLNKRIILLGVLVALTVAAFSVIGNLRNNNELFRLQAAVKPEYEWMPTWMLWFYMYLTTPLSNFAQVTTWKFDYFSGIYSFSSLTPTVLRTAIWGNVPDVVTEVAAQTFNTGTYALAPYLDWGWIGVAGFTGILLMLGGRFYQTFLIRHSLYDLLRLAVLLQVIVLTVFANLFLTWGILFQLVLVLMFRKWLIRIDAFESFSHDSNNPNKMRRYSRSKVPGTELSMSSSPSRARLSTSKV